MTEFIYNNIAYVKFFINEKFALFYLKTIFQSVSVAVLKENRRKFVFTSSQLKIADAAGSVVHP